MATVLIQEFGIDDIIDGLNKLSKPDFRLTKKLGAVLKEQFDETQAATHVITGSLKLSGHTATDFDGDTWTGHITYGGPSAGVNDPVEYAIYEMNRGGAHDFFAGLPAYDAQYQAAIILWAKEQD